MAIEFHDYNGVLVRNTTAAVTVRSYAEIGAIPGYAMKTVAASSGGNDVPYKTQGLVKGVTKSTAAAFVVGDKLKVSTAGVWSKTTQAYWQGFAHAAATAAATTADVVLWPGAN